MGVIWLERHLPEIVNHVLGLVNNTRACPTHVDAVYARKCVMFILRSVIGGVLGEKAQITAAKEICQVIIRHMNQIGNEVLQYCMDTDIYLFWDGMSIFHSKRFSRGIIIPV